MAIALNNATGAVVEPARTLSVARDVDVLVVGGGTSGCMSAIAAARQGARVLLVDRYGFLGGTATAAMVGCFCGIYTCGPNATHQLLVGGLPRETMARLEAAGAGYKYRHRFQVDHEAFKVVLDQWILEAGVELLLHATVVDALVVRGVKVEHVLGLEAPRSHQLTPWAEVTDRRLVYSDRKRVGGQAALDLSGNLGSAE